jgi:putative sigma-54 modulation protein
MTITPQIRGHAERKLRRLERFFSRIMDVHVTATKQRGWCTVEVMLNANGILLRAEERTADVYSSIDVVAEKLERQLKKFKDKLHSRSRGVIRAEAAPLEEGAEPEPEEAPVQVGIVRTKRFPLKPMSPEEAALQMEMLHHSFFVFTNGETQRTNVIYKRHDGNYGLIEPE